MTTLLQRWRREALEAERVVSTWLETIQDSARRETGNKDLAPMPYKDGEYWHVRLLDDACVCVGEGRHKSLIQAYERAIEDFQESAAHAESLGHMYASMQNPRNL